MADTILPGATLGVFGSGQLGRMLAMAAHRLGYRVHVFSPEKESPTEQSADQATCAPYEDLEAVTEFARQVDVVTFEFENVPIESPRAASRYVPVRPSGDVLHTTQNRLREKHFLVQAGLPVAPFREIHSAADLEAALADIGLPAVLKTAGWGYDGKGQWKLDSPEQAHEAWKKLSARDAVLEQFVDFESELSVVAARGGNGELAAYEPIGNVHRHHILDLSVAPAMVPPRVAQHAVQLARQVLESLDVVGVLCVEFFLTRRGELVINELAPRTHNSGHLTIDAHVTSQFEQQVRAVCGLPLGCTRQLQPAAMVNLLGDLWQSGEPDWFRLCGLSDIKLHLYGKQKPRPGRKMGHLTVLAATPDEAAARALEARHVLSPAAAALPGDR